MKVLLFICGEGLDHTSRCLALGKEFLAAGHEVYFGTYGYSKRLVEITGYQTYEIPPEIKLAGEAGIFYIKRSIKETLKNISLSSFRKFLRLIEKLKPDVVILDGYYTGILAAQKKIFLFITMGAQRVTNTPSFTSCLTITTSNIQNPFFFDLKALYALFLLSFYPKIELSDNLFRVG